MNTYSEASKLFNIEHLFKISFHEPHSALVERDQREPVFYEIFIAHLFSRIIRVQADLASFFFFW